MWRLRRPHRTQDTGRLAFIDHRRPSRVSARAGGRTLHKETDVKLAYLLESGVPNWSTEYIYGVQNKVLAASIRAKSGAWVM